MWIGLLSATDAPEIELVVIGRTTRVCPEFPRTGQLKPSSKRVPVSRAVNLGRAPKVGTVVRGGGDARERVSRRQWWSGQWCSRVQYTLKFVERRQSPA